MDKKKIIMISAVLATALVLTFIVIKVNSHKPQSHIEGKIHLLKEETIPLRFKIVSHSNDKMVIAGKFYDLDENMVSRFELPYDNDGPISMQLYDVEIQGRHIIYPYTMTLAEDTEVDLTQYYNANGFPAIYRSSLIDETLSQEIGIIFNYLCNDGIGDVEKLYGKVYYLNTYLANPCERVNYELQTTSSGRAYYLNNNQ